MPIKTSWLCRKTAHNRRIGVQERLFRSYRVLTCRSEDCGSTLEVKLPESTTVLNHQVKVALSRTDHDLLRRLAQRDRQATSALVRRIVLAQTREWERTERSFHQTEEKRTASDGAAVFSLSIKVWFADADFQLVERVAEFHGCSVSACVRDIVRGFGRRLASKPAPPQDRNRP